MKIVFLGTGTSVGVPMIGCSCPVCTSNDPLNKRRRTSLYLETGGLHVVVDTGPDFREQALQYKIPRVDAVFFTHSHADHVFGFDDLRRFNTIQQTVIPVYGSGATIGDLKRIFDYVVDRNDIPGTYRPRIDFNIMTGPQAVGELQADPVEVQHGPKPTWGFVFRAAGRSLGYAPDCHAMSAETEARFRGVDVMVLDTLRHKPHATHLSVEESVKILREIGARQSYLIHLGHDLEHRETQKILPPGILLSYDGLTLEW